jgi:hypothetical protein
VKVRVELTGGDEARRTLRALGDNAGAAMGAALYLEAERIMADSRPLVPVDTGALRASGHVRPAVEGANRVSVIFGYGGPAKKYAVPQHQRTDYRHRVGQAKYLSEPTLAAVSGMPQRIGAGIAAWARRNAR